MYCVMVPFGVFVCSACAGLHRDFSHKVKGISMSTFTDEDIKFLNQNGNKVSHCNSDLLECASQNNGELER